MYSCESERDCETWSLRVSPLSCVPVFWSNEHRAMFLYHTNPVQLVQEYVVMCHGSFMAMRSDWILFFLQEGGSRK